MLARRQRAYAAFVVPSVVFAAVLVTVPFAYAVYLSLRNFSFLTGVNTFIGLGNYLKVVSDKSFWMSAYRNILYVVVVVSANFILGFSMALVCNRPFVGNRLLRSVIVLPMLFLPTAASILWRFMLLPNLGLVSKILGLVGLGQVSWLANSSTAFWTVVFVDIWAWTPWMFLVLLAGLEGLPVEPLESAKIDGCNWWQTVWYITMPLMKPIFFVAISLKAIDTFRTFDYVWVLTQGGPGESSHILSTYVYRTAFNNLNYGYGSAMGLLILGVSVVFSAMVLRRVMRGQTE